jgi:competence protein ComGC
MSARDFFAEERAQGEWSTIYMLLVLVIVALVLIAIVKPMFKQSQKVVARTKADLGAK